MDQTPSNSVQTKNQRIAPLTKKEFNDKYWFNSLQLVTVLNPLKEDYPFMVELRHFIIRAGKTERFPGVIANVYLDGMTKIMAQDDDKLAFMSDPALMKQYYDKLIVDVENLAPEADTTPAYLKDVDPRARAEAKDETPPWDASQGERARDVAPNPTPPVPEVPETPNKPPKAEDKEFELEGVKYKLVVSKDGKSMFYKDGRMCSAADYNRAASML